MDKGAYLSLKKPFDEEILQYLWQIVLKRNMQREKAREGSEKNRDQITIDDIYNNDNINEGESQSNAINTVVRRKYRTKWTDQLHDKFMKVVRQLGDGSKFTSPFIKFMDYLFILNNINNENSYL